MDELEKNREAYFKGTLHSAGMKNQGIVKELDGADADGTPSEYEWTRYPIVADYDRYYKENIHLFQDVHATYDAVMDALQEEIDELSEDEEADTSDLEEDMERISEFELLDADYHRRSFTVRKVPAADCIVCRAWYFYLFIEGVSYLFYLNEEENIFSIIFWHRQEKDALRLESIKKNSRRIEKEGEDTFKIEFPCSNEQIEFYCADYIERKIYRKMLSIDEYIFLRSRSEQDEYQRIFAMQFLSKDQIGILRREGENWIEVMPQVNRVK